MGNTRSTSNNMLDQLLTNLGYSFYLNFRCRSLSTMHGVVWCGVINSHVPVTAITTRTSTWQSNIRPMHVFFIYTAGWKQSQMLVYRARCSSLFPDRCKSLPAQRPIQGRLQQIDFGHAHFFSLPSPRTKSSKFLLHLTNLN